MKDLIELLKDKLKEKFVSLDKIEITKLWKGEPCFQHNDVLHIQVVYNSVITPDTYDDDDNDLLLRHGALLETDTLKYTLEAVCDPNYGKERSIVKLRYRVTFKNIPELPGEVLEIGSDGLVKNKFNKQKKLTEV